MISPTELLEYISSLRAAGVTGRIKIGDVEVTIGPEPVAAKESKPAKSLKSEYDRMLFAATEGIPDEEGA